LQPGVIELLVPQVALKRDVVELLGLVVLG
jgi:hypothetical protein